jgi:hypothetical protein
MADFMLDPCWTLLSSGADEHGGDFVEHDDRIEELLPRHGGQMNGLLADRLDFSADLVAGPEPKFDSLSGLALEDACGVVARLKVELALGECRDGEDGCECDESERTIRPRMMRNRARIGNSSLIDVAG